MYGILTDDAALARDGLGDIVYYLADQVSGADHEPRPDVINSVACWGDTATVSDDPGRAAVDADGTRATPDAKGHHWGTVCPTDPEYRASLLDRIETVGAVGDVRLSTLGFPGEAFCHCDRCERQYAESEATDWTAWRTAVIGAFVRDAAARVEGDLIATLSPDPYPGNLQRRVGLDPQALASHVDGFLVPLCDESYETTYWVETLARGFARELADLDVELTLQLSAGRVAADRLIGLTRQIEPYADAIVYGTHQCDHDTLRAVLHHLDATEPPVPSA